MLEDCISFFVSLFFLPLKFMRCSLFLLEFHRQAKLRKDWNRCHLIVIRCSSCDRNASK